MENYTFDFQRIFLGNTPPLFIVEVVLRTLIMVGYLLLLLRLSGKRSLAQFSLLEFILIIALGSAVGDPMFYAEIPLLHGLMVITVVVGIEQFLVWITNRNHKIEDLLEGVSQCLVMEGRFHLENLKKSTLSRNEIYMELRIAGIEQLGQVRRAYLEMNGKLSIFRFDAEQVRPGLPLFPGSELGEAKYLMAGTPALQAGDYACLYCGEVVSLEAKETFPTCPRCNKEKWIQAERAGIKN